MALRRIPIRRVGIREALFLGGDREMVMMTGLLTFTLLFAAVQVQSSGLRLVIGSSALTLWFLGLYGLRKLAKYDPKIRKVYQRNSPPRYKPYYPARSTPHRKNDTSQKNRYK